MKNTKERFLSNVLLILFIDGFQFQTGLNTDSIPFNPRGECLPGGIYFCELEKSAMWLQYNYQTMYYYRLVSFPDDAQIYEKRDKYKADKLVLSERTKISNLNMWEDHEYCLLACKWNGLALQYVKNQTEELCLQACKSNGLALQYVNNRTEELCLIACKSNGLALQYVNNQTEELCLIACKQHSFALKYVREQTPKLCMQAYKQVGYVLKCVDEKNRKICMETVNFSYDRSIL